MTERIGKRRAADFEYAHKPRATHQIRAAHPRIAGALVRVAGLVADGVRKVVDNGWTICVCLALACVWLYARSQGWVPL